VLHEFLTTHRDALVERCRLKVAKRLAPRVTEGELTHGIPAFLDQLIKTLLVEQTSEPLRSRKVSGPVGGRAGHVRDRCNCGVARAGAVPTGVHS
jgi:hypothetical protein